MKHRYCDDGIGGWLEDVFF